MLGNSILNCVSFQTTNNQINLDILSFVCVLEAHQIDSRLPAQYSMDFLRISLLTMKRTIVTTKNMATGLGEQDWGRNVLILRLLALTCSQVNRELLSLLVASRNHLVAPSRALWLVGRWTGSMVRMGVGTLPRGELRAEGSGSEIHTLLQALLPFTVPLGHVWAGIHSPCLPPCTLKITASMASGLLGPLMCPHIALRAPTQMTSTNLVTWSWVLRRIKCERKN